MKISKAVIAIVVAFMLSLNLVGCGISSKGSGYEDELILYNKNIIKLRNYKGNDDGIKVQIENLRKEADKLLNEPLLSIADKKELLPGASKNDYTSLATYYWSDPSKIDGLPYISKDGEKNPETSNNDKYDAARKSKMVKEVDVLSLAYYTTGDENYALKASDILKYWFINKDTRMNPSLEFAQYVPGKDLGRATGIIDTVDFIPLLDSVNLIRGSKNWTESNNDDLKKWFSQYLDWLLNSKNGIEEAKAENNHGTWYDAQVAAFSLYFGNRGLAGNIVREAKEKRIAKQIEPDGSMPKELKRTKSLAYTDYNLEALITLARIGEKEGVDLWNFKTSDGKSIKKAVDYFTDYLLDKKKWPYENISDYKPEAFMTYLALVNKHYKDMDYKKVIEKYKNRLSSEEKLRILAS